MPEFTYGVGPSAISKNTGPDVSMDSKLDARGRVFDKGVVVFDPTVDMIGQIVSVPPEIPGNL